VREKGTEALSRLGTVRGRRDGRKTAPLFTRNGKEKLGPGEKMGRAQGKEGGGKTGLLGLEGRKTACWLKKNRQPNFLL
jgi:hypothetical protein